MNGTMKSNVVFFFGNMLKSDKNVFKKQISVVNAQFPVSWYLINSNNNRIYINTILYLFPVGDYNVATFISTWKATFGTNWILTYNTITKKITFSNNQPFTFRDDYNSLFPMIGFVTGTTYTSTTNNLTSPCVINFGGILKLNIKTSTFNSNNTDTHNKGKTRTICSVPVNADQTATVFYNNFTQYSTTFKNAYFEDINIEIQDEYKNYIDFNNVNWSITLQIDVTSQDIETLDDMEDIYNSLKQSKK
jgi:hypothetical protein